MDPEELTFKDLEQDIERCCVETGETMTGTPIVRGYDQTRDFVFNAYLENQHYQAVVDYLLKQNWEWGTNKYFDHASEIFVAGRESNYIKQLWHAVLAAQEQNYWATKAVRGNNNSVERSLRKSKQTLLEHLARFRAIMNDLDDPEEVVWIDQKVQALYTGKRKAEFMQSEPGMMDEPVFWEIIERSKSNSSSIPQQINMLTSILSQFSGEAIHVFQQLLHEKMCAAYHWDIWALAYIAQDGCSDDGFEYFRAWLLLQGKTTYTRTLNDIHQVLREIPAGIGTQAEGLLSIVNIAYFDQTGKSPPLVEESRCELEGIPWEPEALQTRYPEIWDYYHGQR